MILYALTVFLSAFLLFQVQPLVGKYILPWFGGTPAVWMTCMLFFQVLLLGGYAYAHATSRALSRRKQAGLHLVLLAASLALLPIIPSEATWKPEGPEHPVGHILLLLLATIGVPYFLVSTTGPLIQDWFARRNPGRSPWRLYALSNVGSLLALLTYPFVVEPALRLNVQCWIWSAGYAGFAILCGACALGQFRGSPAPAVLDDGAPTKDPDRRPPAANVLLWLLLSGCGSLVLLATTNQLCQEVAVVPFLWVLPLVIYLLTFIICFDNPRWYWRPVFLVLLAITLVYMTQVLRPGGKLPVKGQIVTYGVAMFALCMVCHGELVRLKPSPRYLTFFYLAVSTGGALGGLFVVLAATHLFTGYWEYHLALAMTGLLAFITTFRDRTWVLSPLRERSTSRHRAVLALWMVTGLGFAGVCGTLKRRIDEWDRNVLEATRNFYGVLRVEDHGNFIRMRHGSVQHGFQLTDERLRDWPTSYFTSISGIGRLLKTHPARREARPLRIGIVGQGAGTIAVLGRPGDTVRYYEINPEVVRLCEKYFTFIPIARAHGVHVEDTVLGDARLELERELAEDGPPPFDVLVVDAFTSDAIPMHLLTVECADIYRRRLKEDGVLAVHVSNTYLDLVGVVRAMAEAIGWQAIYVVSPYSRDLAADEAHWMIVTGNPDVLSLPSLQEARVDFTEAEAPLAWTDHYGSLWQVIRREPRARSPIEAPSPLKSPSGAGSR